MSHTTLKGHPVQLDGKFIQKREKAPDFRLVDAGLSDVHLTHFPGKKKFIYVVPSLDTEVCLISSKKLNDFAKKEHSIVFIVVSADLPFAQKRVCGLEKMDNLKTLSMMRDKSFGKDYGVLIKDGPLSGVCARAIFALDEHNTVVYSELVSEITHEPTFDKALETLKHAKHA